ncbi:RadC family protein [Oceanisphaera sp. KMM 10153]|uniref:RadC family protein n=1 Tax=Oceanisphaera submarina TaxID=3390193 RepID=UPI0039753782
MSIKDWPAGERPREKLLSRGADSLSDAELLAIFLRTGAKGMDAVTLAQTLIRQFGSLRQLLLADQQSFCEGPGLGLAKFVQLQASLELMRRFLDEKLVREHALTSTELTRQFLQARLRDQTREVFALLLLDNQHRVIEYHELFFGTLDAAAVYPRDIVAVVLKRSAAAVILVHNHPSGVAEPSRADRMITERIQSALGLLDIRVLDHLVVGDGETVSFAERGWL